MKIVTSFDHPPIPVRNCDWSAIDTDTYDGAEDSSNRDQIGRGRTEDEAIEDLIGRLMDDEPAQITQRVRHFDEVIKALTLAETSLGYFAGMRDFEKWTDTYSGTLQDPNGVHAALGAVRAAIEKVTGETK